MSDISTGRTADGIEFRYHQLMPALHFLQQPDVLLAHSAIQHFRTFIFGRLSVQFLLIDPIGVRKINHIRIGGQPLQLLRGETFQPF